MLEKMFFKVDAIKTSFRLWYYGQEKFNVQIKTKEGVLYIGLYLFGPAK